MPGRRRYLQRHPWRRLRGWAWLAIETAFIFVQLMRLVPEPGLRRVYRRHIWRAVKRRPDILLARTYCVKAAMHFHFDRLIRTMRAERAALSAETRQSPRRVPQANPAEADPSPLTA
jgi:hypothetical protein